MKCEKCGKEIDCLNVDFFERNDAETCEDFKNKADFVEVAEITQKIDEGE